MKKIIGFIIVLTAIEQATKLLIAQFGMNVDIVLISGILRFRPVQNTNLIWVADMAGYRPNIYVIIIMQIFVALIFVLIYRYISYICGKYQRIIDTGLIFSLSGVCCSLIDVVFWGGSLDYIRLFDWFTFDMKDVFLTMQALLILLLMIPYIPYYYSLSKEERKQQGIGYWIKKGLPVKIVK